MSQGEETQFYCVRCHAKVTANSVNCRKCGLTITADSKYSTIVEPEGFEYPKSDANMSSFGVSTLLLITTLIAVCLALFAAAPGLGILLAVISLPAFLRTLMVVQRKKSQGRDVSTETKIGLYLGSFGVTLVVTFVTISVASLTFCLTCLGVYSVKSTNGPPETLCIVIATGFTLVVTGLLVWSFAKWIRLRWNRDTAREINP